MRELFILLVVALALSVAYWVPVHVMEPLRAKRALYAATGESRILSENRADFVGLTVVAPQAINNSSVMLEFATLVERLACKYPASDEVRLAKDTDPVIACMGLTLLRFSGHEDFLLRFADDQRVVDFRSGCTVRGPHSVADIVRRYWGFDDYAERNSRQLRLFGVVIFD